MEEKVPFNFEIVKKKKENVISRFPTLHFLSVNEENDKFPMKL